MEKHIYDAYVKDGWHVFELYRTTDGKGNAVKGMYATPKGWNDTSKKYKYKPNAIYAGIPPKDMVAIDYDVKKGKNGDKSFEKLQKDLGITLETHVITPSGGGHAYCWLENLPEDKPKLKKSQIKYPDIDFQSNGSEFVVLGGQVIEGYGEYKFVDEDFEYDVNAPFDASSLELRSERSEAIEYEDIDEDEHWLTRPPLEQITEWLDSINPSTDYNIWQQTAMALNSWDLGGEQGMDLFVQWSLLDEDEISEYGEDAVIKKAKDKYKLSKADTPEFYKKLVGIVNQESKQSFEKAFAEAETDEDFEKLAEEISQSSISNQDRVEYANKIADREKELGLTSRKNKSKWEKLLKRQVDTTPKPVEGLDVYIVANKYALVHNNTKLIEDIGKQYLRDNAYALGYDKNQVDNAIKCATPISSVETIPDYNIQEHIKFVVEENTGTQLQSLVVRSNPLYEVHDYIHDEEVLEDFCMNIWNGKAEDLVKLMALTIKFKEYKLNRLMLVAPSNTGKSEIFRMLNFQKITMKRLLNGMRADKGIGPQVIKGIKKSALLLIDEANDALPQEIKDMDKELHVDQFGSGGTQVLPLHFTALTSTHKTATRNSSDELFNRFLQIELTSAESKYTIINSPLFIKNPDYYSSVVKSYLLALFKDVVTSEEYTRADLKALQEKYRLPMNNDLDLLLYDISKDIIEMIKYLAKDQGDIVKKGDEYFIKRKTIISDSIEDKLKEHSNLDAGKYIEKLTEHFVIKLDTQNGRKKINGNQYYKIQLKPYYENSVEGYDPEIVDEFEDLDELD